MPSFGLIAGVMSANVIVSLCAVAGVIVTPRLPWEYVANIWAYDLAWLLLIDCCKIAVNTAIGNSHDDILEYSDLPAHLAPPAGAGTRMSISNSSARSNSISSQQGRDSVAGGQRQRMSKAQARLSQRASVFDPAGAARASYTPRSSSLRPSLPANVARERGSAAGWGAYTKNAVLLDAQLATAEAANEPLVSRLV